MKIIASALLFSILLLAACSQKQEQGKEANDTLPQEINYSELGNLVVSQSQKALGGELKAAMQRGGVSEAVAYCNVQALPLTDSLANFYKVTIKRATSKPRNSLNQATEAELKILQVWETKKQNDGEISAVLFEGEEAVEFYSPILIQPLCTNCHGTIGETLTIENNQIIKEKYPNDQATGYLEGDLRGMWHLSFRK